MRQPSYDEEEFGRRGDEIYERDIEPKLKPDNPACKFVAIDVETGDYEVAADELAASRALHSRRPNARVWLRRVGSRYLYRIGYHRPPTA